MNVYVYATDRSWFEFLREQPGRDEVNFWRPGGEQPFRQLSPGELLLFRLRTPVNAIAGGGTFTHFSFAPVIKAWEAFGIKNGTPDLESLLAIIARHKRLERPQWAATANIGCIVLTDPFFLPNEKWIPVPEDYQVNSPQGQRFDAAHGSGAHLLAAVTDALRATRVSENGLLLRSDIHGLFDRGYVTVQPDGNFQVSKYLSDDWQNGRVYYDLSNKPIRRPARDEFAPLRVHLEWHNETVFRR